MKYIDVMADGEDAVQNLGLSLAQFAKDVYYILYIFGALDVRLKYHGLLNGPGFKSPNPCPSGNSPVC